MFNKIKNFTNSMRKQWSSIDQIHRTIANNVRSPKVNLGQIQTHLNNQKGSINSIHEVEFQVFSQWGDDGIIQYIISKTEIPSKTFIEFGVETYNESNTRFLLINNNWSGYVIDGSESNINFINKDTISWMFDLHTKKAFITKENINELLQEFVSKGYSPEIGILSIDIDGNDYWIWKEINVINPIVVIIEYNAVFGPEKSWTIPYDKDFYRLDSHGSHQYWGASLAALCNLGEQKGYAFIGCNSNGNNAYFIRKDKIGQFKRLSPTEGYVESKFREDQDQDGNWIIGKKRLELIRGKKIYDTGKGVIENI